MSYQSYPPQSYPPQSSPPYRQRRTAPFSVHVVAFLIYLGGLLVLLGALAVGALALGVLNLSADDLPEDTQQVITGAGIAIAVVLLVIALLYFLVARKLQRGRNWARILVLVLSVLGLIGSVLQIVGLVQMDADPAVIGSAIGSVIGPLLFILLLNTSAARSWFRSGTY